MDYLKKAKNSKTLGWRKGQRKEKNLKNAEISFAAKKGSLIM